MALPGEAVGGTVEGHGGHWTAGSPAIPDSVANSSHCCPHVTSCHQCGNWRNTLGFLLKKENEYFIHFNSSVIVSLVLFFLCSSFKILGFFQDLPFAAFL
jgi:hypothetical protein